MSGLARVLKLYVAMEIVDDKGKKVIWVYDYANDKPRLKSEMSREELKASERAKWLKC